MAKKRRTQARLLPKSSTAEELDALNTRLINRSNAAERIRRVVEAQIEGKARKRRKRETPASSGYKRV